MAAVTALVPSATAASTAIIDLRISTFSVVLDASQRRLRQMVTARAIEQMASRQCGETTRRSPIVAIGRKINLIFARAEEVRDLLRRLYVVLNNKDATVCFFHYLHL